MSHLRLVKPAPLRVVQSGRVVRVFDTRGEMAIAYLQEASHPTAHTAAHTTAPSAQPPGTDPMPISALQPAEASTELGADPPPQRRAGLAARQYRTLLVLLAGVWLALVCAGALLAAVLAHLARAGSTALGA